MRLPAAASEGGDTAGVTGFRRDRSVGRSSRDTSIGLGMLRASVGTVAATADPPARPANPTAERCRSSAMRGGAATNHNARTNMATPRRNPGRPAVDPYLYGELCSPATRWAAQKRAVAAPVPSFYALQPRGDNQA